MKLKNETTAIVKDNEGAKMTYADFAKVCINVMPEGGLDVLQMKTRLDVVTNLEAANGEIVLTSEEQVKALKECVKSMKWALIHKDVVDFTEAVEKL